VPDPTPILPSSVGDKLIAIHESLDAAGIKHAFGGAIALAYAVAEPRATNDIDINIAAPVEQARFVVESLPQGVLARPDVVERIMRDGQDRLRWGDSPVDLFFPQHEFHAVVAGRALQEPFRNTVIPVIAPTDLTVFKALFNRRKDWPDIEEMLLAQTVDEAEALRWLTRVLGPNHASVAKLAELIAEVRANPQVPQASDPNVWTQLRSATRNAR
jgi:hypothetical protein